MSVRNILEEERYTVGMSEALEHRWQIWKTHGEDGGYNLQTAHVHALVDHLLVSAAAHIIHCVRCICRTFIILLTIEELLF